MATLTCDGWCNRTGTVAWIDNKGYAYCAPCGEIRRSSGIPSRALTGPELAHLQAGHALPGYARNSQADLDAQLARLAAARANA